MNAAAPKVTAREEGGTIVVRIEAAAPVAPADELRALNAIADEWGLERRGLAVAVRRAGVPTIRVGRQIVARKSDVLRLVERLAHESASPASSSSAMTPEASYARAVARSRAK